jgi:hypothetical protein
MLVKFLGLKISLEIIILMLVIYLVMMVHALASCCNSRAIAEGFSDIMTKNQNKNKKAPSKAELAAAKRAADLAGKSRTFSFNDKGKLVENIII